jgi:hypothetical protein
MGCTYFQAFPHFFYSPTSIQRLLDHRLLRAALSPKCPLQAFVTAHPLIDFNHSPRPTEDADQAIVELFCGTIFHRLLRYLHPLSNRQKQIQSIELGSDACQETASRKV